MKNTELLKEFVRIEKTLNEVQILIRKIRWEGPHTPISTWAVGKSLPDTASESKIEDAITDILEDLRHFRSCLECGERNPLGWMHDESICQGCAEAKHGIVY